MRLRLLLSALLATAYFATLRADQLPPRDIWPQAVIAAREGDLDRALKKTTELMETGKAYGLKRYPVYASAAAGFARQSVSEGKTDLSSWADKTSTQLDPKS